jgi:glycosyltransferase involved in cell wall biosynthesis
MTNYNYERFLTDALTAIVQQSYRPHEILVIDDASTDNSVQVIERFQKEHSNIRLIRNERNMGVLHNANLLYQMASGDYVYSASSDDRILPGLFEKSIAVLEQHPEAALCFSDSATFVEGYPLYEHRLHLTSSASYFSPEELIQLCRKKKVEIASHGALLRLKDFRKIGLIDQLRWHCDWFANWVMAFRDGACYVPEPLATIRMHSGSYSSRRKWRDQVDICEAMFKLLRTDYSDVRSHFERSSILWSFKAPMLYAALRHSENRSFLNPLLVQRALSREIHDLAAGMAGERFRAAYRSGHQRINSGLLTMELHR